MFLRVRVVPIVVPHINRYSNGADFSDVPDWVAILTLGLLLLAGIIAIIAIFKIK